MAQLAGFENIFDATCGIGSRGSRHDDLPPYRPIKPGTFVSAGDSPDPRRTGHSRAHRNSRRRHPVSPSSKPEGLSARNVIAGRIVSVERRDMIVSARVDCGVEMEVHLTLAARDALQLEAGSRGLAGDQDPLLSPDAEITSKECRTKPRFSTYLNI